MDVISFDIETIPQQAPLTELQIEELNKKLPQKLKQKYGDKSEYTPQEIEAVKALTMATNYFLGEIVTIGLYRNNGTKEAQVALVGTEKEILTNFWDTIHSNIFKGLFVSFNGLAFDVPFIINRSIYHEILPTNNSFLDLKRFSKWPHFDVKMIFSHFDIYGTGTLASICEFVNVQSPKDGEIKADGVEQAYKDGKINLIAEYCLRDVVATYQVYEKIKNYTFQPTFKQ